MARSWRARTWPLRPTSGDGTRASLCLALLDGRAWTATELARHAGVAVPTATEHLNLLVGGGCSGRSASVVIATSASPTPRRPN